MCVCVCVCVYVRVCMTACVWYIYGATNQDITHILAKVAWTFRRECQLPKENFYFECLIFHHKTKKKVS